MFSRSRICNLQLFGVSFLFSSFVPLPPRTQIVSHCNRSLEYSTAIKMTVHYYKRGGTRSWSSRLLIMRYFRALKHSQPITTAFPMPGMAVHRKMCSFFAFGPDISRESSHSMNDAEIPKLCTVKLQERSPIDNSPCEQSYQWRFRQVTQISPWIRTDAATQSLVYVQVVLN